MGKISSNACGGGVMVAHGRTGGEGVAPQNAGMQNERGGYSASRRRMCIRIQLCVEARGADSPGRESWKSGKKKADISVAAQRLPCQKKQCRSCRAAAGRKKRYGSRSVQGETVVSKKKKRTSSREKKNPRDFKRGPAHAGRKKKRREKWVRDQTEKTRAAAKEKE